MAQKNRLEKYYQRRLAALLAAQFVMGFAIVLLRFALFGNDPFSCMNLGFANVSGLSFGTCSILFNLVAIVPIFILDKNYIQIGTLINMFMVGPIVDAYYYVLSNFPMLVAPTLEERIFLLISGVVVCCLGASLYMMPQMGIGPYDAIGWILAARSKGRLSFRSARVIEDICAVTIGFINGSIVHIGTLIMAFGTGPLVAFFNEYVSIPLIYNGKKGLVKAR